MKQTLIILTLALFTNNLLGQADESNLEISGNIKVQVGQEITIPLEAMIEIKQLKRFEIPDSLGNFRIDNLSPGNYHIIIHGYQPSDTLIKLDQKSIKDLNLLAIAACEVNKEIAERDIKRNKPSLLLIGGDVPIEYSNQKEFEQKYNIEYYDFGCDALTLDCITQYNQRIFEHLDAKFGKGWRTEVREDVIGLKK